jgi:hypothetical protein
MQKVCPSLALTIERLNHWVASVGSFFQFKGAKSHLEEPPKRRPTTIASALAAGVHDRC